MIWASCFICRRYCSDDATFLFAEKWLVSYGIDSYYIVFENVLSKDTFVYLTSLLCFLMLDLSDAEYRLL